MTDKATVLFSRFHGSRLTERQLEEQTFLGTPLNAWIALGAGALIAIVDSLFWTSRYTLHFISTLAHEMGHAGVATFSGAPSFPTISLTGHAAAWHGGQFTWMALFIWAFIAYVAWHKRDNRAALISLVVLGAVYPLLAFTSGWELLVLLSGHGGELAFAGICFFRAWTGGFTQSTAERTAYATCGWFGACSNLGFHFRLMTDPGFRSHYADSGSFGLTNDYIRVADDFLGCSVSAVAFGMLVVNVLVLPALIFLAVRIYNRL